MKTRKLFIASVFATINFLMVTINCKAQYVKLLDFVNDSIHGINPWCDLIQANDGMIYGLAFGGGANNMGVLFQYDPVSSTYTNKLDFAGSTNGKSPASSLMQADDGMLYGVASYGGTNNMGVLFQFNPITSSYIKKIDFAGVSNGSRPYSSLIQASDGMLYGMTYQGGSNNKGVLFQYNPVSNSYIKKIDFAGATNGSFPNGTLLEASDGMIYGMTYTGGTNNAGVLFQYNPATSTYIKKLNFAGVSNGSESYGSLIQASDGMLYGMTYTGGTNNLGVLFQFNPISSIYIKKIDFAGATNGSNPFGSLLQASDGMLYGMTYSGGANNKGVLFQYNPTNSTYTKNIDFSGTANGSNPWGSLVQANDGMLYGMTNKGGTSTSCTNGCGALFKYGLTTSILESNEVTQLAVFPNPVINTMIISGIANKATIKVYDLLGNLVISQITVNSNQLTLDLSQLVQGVYTLVTDSNNNRTYNKVIVSR